MEATDLNSLWASLLVEELARIGVTRFVIAPGSRSTPLAVAAFRNSNADTLVHFDERGAAFFALGCARMGSPAAVICTSGTAVANCLPAVAEAFHAALPLVILSADRPPELQACAANQTMDQAELFGRHVRGCLNLPCPDASIPAEVVLTKIDALLAAGLLDTPGPVHINCMFREPLAPVAGARQWPEMCPEGLESWQRSDLPFVKWEKSARTLSSAQCADLARVLSGAEKGLVLIGRLYEPGEQAAALKLASDLGWPVFADITSGCRRFDSSPHLVCHYDVMLRSAKFRELCTPDCVLHLGDVFVSRQLQEHLRRVRPEYIQISSRFENRDPLHRVTRRLAVDISTLPENLGVLFNPPRTGFRDALVAADETAFRSLRRAVDSESGLTELTIAQALDEILPSNVALLLGNSMPVRDMDILARHCRPTVVHANRGVSGIDGNLATAAGMKWSSPAGLVALIGDMAALHDLNSLALLSTIWAKVIVIIVNNQGGGIFSFLPIAEHGDVFEPCFTNPHSWRFEHAAAQFNLDYIRVENKEAFEASLRAALERRTSLVLEVAVGRDGNVRAHRRCYADVARDVDVGLS